MLRSVWSQAWPPCQIAAQAGCAMHAADVQGGIRGRAQLCERGGLGGTRKHLLPSAWHSVPWPGWVPVPSTLLSVGRRRVLSFHENIKRFGSVPCSASGSCCGRGCCGQVRAQGRPGAARPEDRARCSPSKWKACLFLGYRVSGRKAGNCQGFYWIPVKGI